MCACVPAFFAQTRPDIPPLFQPLSHLVAHSESAPANLFPPRALQKLKSLDIISFFFFFFFAAPCSLWDLSSPTRDRTQALDSESEEY